MRARDFLLLSFLVPFALLASGCEPEGCLSGDDPGCIVPSPCERVAFECSDPAVSIQVLQEGDPIPGGLNSLASPGDILLSNSQVEAVIDALDHPHYLAPTGGTLLDLGTTGDGNDSMRNTFQATGVLPDEAAFYTDLEILEEEGLVAVVLRGHLDGRPDVPIYTRYELRACDPAVRIRTELVNLEADPLSVLLADGYYLGRRELIPFTPDVGRGFAQPSFGLSTLGDAVMDAPFLALSGHSAPAASYAAVSCTSPSITGFQSTEVAANGMPRRILMPRDWEVYERMIVAARGSQVSGAADLALDIRRQLFGESWVELQGRLVSDEENPGFGGDSRATIVVSEGSSSQPAAERTPWTQTVPDEDGSFVVRVPQARSYVVEVSAFGRPAVEVDVAVGGGPTDAGEIPVPSVGRLVINATVDGAEDHVLAFVLPADDATEDESLGSQFGQFVDCAPLLGGPHGGSPGCNRVLVDGPVEVGVLPGTYDVFAIAGPFSTLSAVRGLVVEPGQSVAVQLGVETIDGLQPEGTLTGDFHVHGGVSFDSNMPHFDRVRALLASRVQVVAATEHDAAWDFAEARQALDADGRFELMVGTENTGHILFKLLPDSQYPKVVGHWNIWPFDFDPEGPYRGAWWDELAEPGMLFTRAQEAGWPAETGVAQLNHPIGGASFGRDYGWGSALGLDLTVPLPSAFDGTEPSLFSRTPEGAAFANSDFHAQEVMNGTDNGTFLKYRAFWHYLLNQGVLRAGTANSDSHSLSENVVGLPLTLVWTDSSVGDFDEAEFNGAVRDGRMMGTSGPVLVVETTDADGAQRSPSLEAFEPDAQGELRIRVSAAPWVPVTEVRILVNGELVRTLTDELAPLPADPFGSDGLLRLDVSLPLDELLPSEDAWLVVEAGWPLEPNEDLDCDGIPDTGDNNRDGTIDWRDVEALAEAGEAPEGPCLESSGPLTDPEEPENREGPFYLYRSVVPEGYPLAFTNPLLFDWGGDGFDAPGLAR